MGVHLLLTACAGPSRTQVPQFLTVNGACQYMLARAPMQLPLPPPTKGTQALQN